MARMEIDAQKCARQIVMNVTLTGVRIFAFRLKLALLFIRLGVWISGMGLHVVATDAGRQTHT